MPTPAHKRMAPFLLFLAVSPLPALAQSSAAGGTVLTEKEAYLLLPPELIAAPVVERIEFSPDERFALVKRSSLAVSPDQFQQLSALQGPPPRETSLVFWDSRTRKPKEVWTATDDLNVRSVQWMPASGTAFVLLNQFFSPPPISAAEGSPAPPPSPAPQQEPGAGSEGMPREAPRPPRILQTLLRIAPDTAKAQVVAQSESEVYDALDFSVSPVKPLAVLRESRYTDAGVSSAPGVVPEVRGVNEEKILHIVDEKGYLGAKVTLTESADLYEVAWDREGFPVLKIMEIRPGVDKPALYWYALNPRTARLQPLDAAPALYVDDASKIPKAAAPLQIKPSSVSAKEGQESRSLGVIWLENRGKAESQAMVCGDCLEGRLLPRGDAVVYRAQGAAWSMPLMKISREQREAMLRQARKTVAINRAKQIGVMLMMYASDNDETLPRSEELSKLATYAGNRDPSEWLNGFTYAPPPGPLAAIENPSETVLGTMTGPGGRAVLYVDGHVVWKDD